MIFGICFKNILSNYLRKLNYYPNIVRVSLNIGSTPPKVADEGSEFGTKSTIPANSPVTHAVEDSGDEAEAPSSDRYRSPSPTTRAAAIADKLPLARPARRHSPRNKQTHGPPTPATSTIAAIERKRLEEQSRADADAITASPTADDHTKGRSAESASAKKSPEAGRNARLAELESTSGHSQALSHPLDGSTGNGSLGDSAKLQSETRPSQVSVNYLIRNKLNIILNKKRIDNIYV